MGTAIANVGAEEFWSARAGIWLEDEDELEIFGKAPGDGAIERLDPRAGEHILDIGCGGGATTLQLAQRVGPAGSVLGIDIAAGMVAGAQRRAEAAGVTNAAFRVADAQVADLGDRAFDAAFSRFGVMFFADPVAAFTNIRRCLVPGGRVSFSAWQGPFDNDWMLVPTMVTLGVLGVAPPQPDPDLPGPFSLAVPGEVQQILQKAGFGEVDIALRNDAVELTGGDIERRASTALRHGYAAELLADAPEETRQRVNAALRETMRARMQAGVARLSRGALLVTARAAGDQE